MKGIIKRAASLIVPIAMLLVLCSCTAEEKGGGSMGMYDPKAERKLVWSEEFNQKKLDRDTWSFEKTMTCSDHIYNNSDNCVRVENGKLLLRTYRGEVPFNSGISIVAPEGMTTRYSMNYRYGYVEMRAKLPFAHAAWPSFWMKTDTPFAKADYMSEFDIIEVFSSADTVSANLHKWGYADRSGHESMSQGKLHKISSDGDNLRDEYHVYGFLWNEERVAWYVDGVEYYSRSIKDEDDFDGTVLQGMDGFHDPAYLIMNNEIFSPAQYWCPGEYMLNDSDPLPQEYYVDWIRLYQNPETESLYLKEDITARYEQIMH